MALVDMTVVEQRYRAVLAVQRGETKTDVAAQFGVSRQSVHSWCTRYAADGLAGLVDRSHRPQSCLRQTSAEMEAWVCEIRREHPGWGAYRELLRTRPNPLSYEQARKLHGARPAGAPPRPRSSRSPSNAAPPAAAS